LTPQKGPVDLLAMKRRFAMNGKDVIEQSLAMRIARV
jgi:hypothetical protein